MSNVLEVRAEGPRWVVVRPDQSIQSTHPTQQAAIEAAKTRAARVHGEVYWRDREGALQFADYRLFTWLPRRPWWARFVQRGRVNSRGFTRGESRHYGDGQESV
jgi:Uncharacterized protein conserved in bacteria (DUF2188)